MEGFLHDFNFPRTNRLNLAVSDWLRQLGNVKDLNGNPMINGPRLLGVTKAGQGFNVEYPTARLKLVRPEVEVLPSGEQINLFLGFDIQLLFRFNARDEDTDEIEIQQDAFAFADYVWNWLTPGPGYVSDNPNGMVPMYPDVWRWDDRKRPQDNITRSVLRLGTEVTGMTGSLWAITLSAPIRINNPLAAWPIS
ncbi:hypothetical protein KGP36_07725 [Patescibacteria group bacterium]|nr:hypothetical protein [Patescibacteria group bacterium]